MNAPVTMPPVALPASYRRKRLTAVLLLAVTAGLSVYLSWPRTAAPSLALATKIPLQLGDWVGTEEPLDQRTLSILGTDDVLSRVYERLGTNAPPLTFLVIFARSTRRATHPPEICLAGEGYRIDNMTSRPVDVGPAWPDFAVRELKVARPGRERLVYYYFRHGSHYDTSYWRHQIRVAMAKLLNPNASDAIVRVETEVDAEGGLDAARARLDAFMRAVLPRVDACLPND